LADLVLETPAAATGLLLDGLLGTDRRAARVARLPATETEQRLFGRVVAMFWEAFRTAWRPIAEFELVATCSTTDCRSLRCAQPDDEVNLLEFRVAVGQHATGFRCCLPADWLARLLARRIADRRKTTEGNDEQQTADPAALEVIVSLADTSMSSSDLANLRVGDIIATGKDVGEPLDVSIDGAMAFRANLDKAGNKKAVRIVEKIPAADANTSEPEE
jgi:flagellar motor switch protein FliM